MDYQNKSKNIKDYNNLSNTTVQYQKSIINDKGQINNSQKSNDNSRQNQKTDNKISQTNDNRLNNYDKINTKTKVNNTTLKSDINQYYLQKNRNLTKHNSNSKKFNAPSDGILRGYTGNLTFYISGSSNLKSSIDSKNKNDNKEIGKKSLNNQSKIMHINNTYENNFCENINNKYNCKTKEINLKKDKNTFINSSERNNGYYKKDLIKNNIISILSKNEGGKKLIDSGFHENKNNYIKNIDKKDTLQIIKLRNIKSSFIIKKIFSHLSKKNELKIIKYNKHFQQICFIDIDCYKKISDKYIIREINGIVKEYNMETNKLIYEGEYKKGKRDGKGKEYNNNELIFEGTYVKGKRNGIGKEYKDNKLIYEGTYVNDKRWNGIGKEYNNNELIFEGKYFDGKRWRGERYYYGYKCINCIIKNGNGEVKEFFSDGSLQFEYKNNNGEETFKEYEKVTIPIDYWEQGDTTERHYLKFKCEYKNGKEEGEEYILNEYGGGLIFEGEYSNGIKNGKGKEYSHGDIIFEGEYLNGRRNGKGKEFSDGKIKFEGEYLNGRRNGQGKEYSDGKIKFEGEYSNGYRWNGKKKKYNLKGELECEVEYVNGEKKI